MRQFSILIWLVGCSLASFGQTTALPKVQKSSSPDVKIQKIELTAEATVIDMVFQAKETNSGFPDMPPMFQDPRFRSGGGITSSISIQPSAYLQIRTGQKFTFKKAEGIPVAPERKSVKPGDRVAFRLFFDRLPPGYERIDLVESATKQEDGYSYWNFYGVQILNPADPSRPIYLPLRGKVLDQENDQPLRATVWCLDAATGKVLDSLQTSRSGTFEFELPAGPIVVRAAVQEYEPSELNYTLRDQISDRTLTLWMNRMAEVLEKPIEIPEKNRFTLDQVFFQTGLSTLLPESFPQLDSLAAYLKTNPRVKIRIEGHTDQVGDPALNQKLSLDRAFRVREYLVKKGIPGERMAFVGYGDTRPKVVGESEKIRQLNRRVEFILLEDEGN